MEADESCRQLLVQQSGQLAQLCGVLTALTASSGTLTQQGLQELECRQNVTGLVLLYTQVSIHSLHNPQQGTYRYIQTSVVDPNTLNLDLDPEFSPNLDPDPGLCNQF